MKRLCSVVLLIILGILTSCADQIVESTPSIIDENNDAGITAKFSDIQNKIFNQSCAFNGCHSSGGVNPNLSGISYSNIVSKQSSTGLNYIEPGDPSNSYLLQKVLGSNSISGNRMPLNSVPLSQSQIEVLTNWIQNGALNN